MDHGSRTVDRLAAGGWRLAAGGNWELEIGNWKLDTGNWKLEIGKGNVGGLSAGRWAGERIADGTSGA